MQWSERVACEDVQMSNWRIEFCGAWRKGLLVMLAGLLHSGWTQVFGQVPEVAGNGLAAVAAGSQAAADEYQRYGIYAQTAPRPQAATPVTTRLPLELQRGDRIVVIGNTLAERSQGFGQFEAMLQQAYPQLELVVRYLAWSGDQIGLQPRPDNFADTEQHLLHERADVVVAMFGFNESFAGEAGLGAFEDRLREWLKSLRTKSFNGKTAARVVLVGPPAAENVRGVAAADLNNANLRLYGAAMFKVSAEQEVGYVDVYGDTAAALESPGSDLTINGVHFGQEGDLLFSRVLFQALFGRQPPQPRPDVVAAIVDRNQQYFRRFRPLNTFYYTGGRNRDYGYLDFLPAMRNFDLMTEVRDRRIHDLVAGRPVPDRPDDSHLPQLPPVNQSRGANEWLSAADEQRAFQVDSRFEVNLFAGEEQFPEIANPIQMRWDSRGRLWVSCSTTYPHVYPGREPDDRLVILEDVDGDGRADRSQVFAEGLHLPLSFEFGEGGVFVSEQPHLTFLKDMDGDDRADERRVVLSGFGTEDSHHALHDFTWTPDGDLILRESIFHHSQVETPYGPVRQQNSGWFRWEPSTHRLVSFGSYPSTNPWGVTFDDWGQHTASHPVYAAAFHALDPPYPQQHPVPKGLQAYSGVCGQQFVDTPAFPDELQGHLIRVRYKPTNRIELLAWKEGPFGFEEEYVGDLLFSTNLSFIPVDLQFGPRGDLYVCDWYNPVKGHAQYSLRDERRDRHSGRIWRITAKGRALSSADPIATASIPQLLDLLKRREAAVRYRVKRELRSRDAKEVLKALEGWVADLSSADERFRHHQLEALWVCRWLGLAPLATSVAPVNPAVVTAAVSDGAPRELPLRLLKELLGCENHRARAAAVQQLRYWHPYLKDAPALLRKAASDANGIVRMEAVIAASYLGSRAAFEAAREALLHPRGGHLSYAMVSAFGSASLRQYWESEPGSEIARMLKAAARETELREPKATRAEAAFDRREGVKSVTISCLPERMLFSSREFFVRPGQPVKLVLLNADATDHNLVITRPGALEEVGLAANAMAKDPRNAASDFVPLEKGELILAATPMVGPSRATQVAVLRFEAPQEPGLYPYVCTFPGHWIVMNGMMVVAASDAEATAMLEAGRPAIVREWSMADFSAEDLSSLTANTRNLELGMAAFVKARCSQCHVVGGAGVNLGPDLVDSRKTLKGAELLQQILEPSLKIHEKFQAWQFVTDDGRVVTGVVVKETNDELQIAADLLRPGSLTSLKKSTIEEQVRLTVSAMPPGLLNGLTKTEILQLLVWLEHGELVLPESLRKQHGLGK